MISVALFSLALAVAPSAAPDVFRASVDLVTFEQERGTPTITILGWVVKPGRYDLKDDALPQTSLTAAWAVRRAGGVHPNAQTSGTECVVIRLVDGKKREIVTTGEEVLQPNDTVFVRPRK